MKTLLQNNLILILQNLNLNLLKRSRSSLDFASFMENRNSTQAESALTVNELKEAFFFA